MLYYSIGAVAIVCATSSGLYNRSLHFPTVNPAEV